MDSSTIMPMTIQAWKSRLLRLHPGYFQTDDYLVPWLSQPVLDLLDRHAVVMRPKNRVHLPGEPLQCIRTALSYALEHPTTAQPYFGFALYLEADGDHRWWIHNINIEADIALRWHSLGV
jgi:hypothetical protein